MTIKNTKEAFIEKAKKVHGNKYGYDKVVYVNTKVNIEIYCKKHDHYFSQRPNNHLHGQNCPKIARENGSKKQSTGKDVFIRKASEKHHGKYKYNKIMYVNNITKVTIYCNTCKEYFEQKPRDHLKSNGCKKCGIKSRTSKRRLTNEQFIEKSNDIHGKDSYDYSKVNYVNNHTKVEIICNICTRSYFTRPMEHLRVDNCPLCSKDNLVHNNKPKTTKQFIEQAKSIHPDKEYDYSETIYINDRSKVTIKCKDHGNFSIVANRLLNGAKCPGCNIKVAKYTREGFIEKANIINDNKYDYSEVNYINGYTKVIIICPTKNHGKFLQRPQSHLTVAEHCPVCRNNKSSTTKAMTNEEFIEKAKLIHQDKYDYSKVEYVNSHINVLINCPDHGDFTQTPTTHLSGSGCPIHGKELSKQKRKMPLEEFIRKSNIIHQGIYDYSETKYINGNTNVQINCDIHGPFFKTPIAHIHRCEQCPKCKPYGYSKKAIAWLKFVSYIDDINIQHAENNCEYKIPGTNYRADGYCKKTNTIYEFHGCYFHGCPSCYNPEDTDTLNKKPHRENLDYTANKHNEIEKQGYNLVHIWEHDWDLLHDSSIMDEYYNKLDCMIDLAMEIMSYRKLIDKPLEYKIYTSSIKEIRLIIRILLKNWVSSKKEK